MILDSGFTAMDIIKAIGAVVGPLIVLTFMFVIKNLYGRMKAIEDKQGKQEVKNQSFIDNDIYSDKQNKEFKDSVSTIGDKIDKLKESNVALKGSFENKFSGLTKSIHQLELKIANGK